MNEILNEENIILNKKLSNKYEAIVQAGTILYENGYVEEEYIKDMIDREHVISTYIGNMIAIPHGIEGCDEHILKSGISIIQVPDGVSFGEEKPVYLIIGIAGKNNEHMDILMNISLVCCEVENVHKLIKCENKSEIMNMFNEFCDQEKI